MYRPLGAGSPFTVVPFALSRSMRYGLTRPSRSPNSFFFSMYRNWIAACCFEQLGWSIGKSTTSLSLPTSQQLRPPSSTVSSRSSPLNMYKRHASFPGGFRASGGSWYLRTIDPPLTFTVLVSAARRPVFVKLGFSLSAAGVESSESPIGVPLKASCCD